MRVTCEDAAHGFRKAMEAEAPLAQHQRPVQGGPLELKCCFVARFVRLSVKAIIAFDVLPCAPPDRPSALPPAARSNLNAFLGMQG
jgi:hypothetical protein